MKRYPLTRSQMGVFAECMKMPDTSGYNLPYITRLPDSVDMSRLRAAWEKLISRHSIFKNRFAFDEQGEVYQYCDRNMEIPVIYRRDSEKNVIKYIVDGFMRPFNILSGEPLVRVELVETEKCKYMFSDMHHTIGDGSTMISVILHQELPALYEGREPDAEIIDLYHAAEIEENSIHNEEYEKAKEYYAQLFADVECATLSADLHAEPAPMIREVLYTDREAVDNWCAQHGVKIHHLFRGAFVYTMGTFCRQNKLAYFSSHAGRSSETVNTIGMFVKSVPMVDVIDENSTVKEWLRHFGVRIPVRLSAYPFMDFCADIKKEPTLSFNYMGMPSFSETFTIEGETVPCGVSVRGVTNADLSVHIYYHPDSYEIRLESSEALNSRETLKMVGRAVRNVTLQMMSQPDALVKELSLVNEDEVHDIISLSKGEDMPYDNSKTWLDLFRDMVEKYPENTAVSDDVSDFSYAWLDRISDSIAQYLIEKGIQKEDFIAVRLPRKKEFIAAVTGIHKAGAAYVPVDPEYPRERVDYMLSDSEAKLLLDELYVQGDHIVINGEKFPCGSLSQKVEVKPENLAYMIYTSGSTGKPKGVMLQHRGLMNFTVATAAQNELTPADRVASHRSFSFDAHIEDVFPVLASGASVHIMPDSIRKDLDAMAAFLNDRNISGCGFTTSIARMLLQDHDLKVRYMTAGGEALSHIGSDTVQIINEYGPTECTNDSCVYKLQKGKFYTSVPIGRPMPNSYCFIVDCRGHLLPKGASGELCYAGPQVGRGYWKLEEKTEEVFGDCPFVEGIRMYHTGDMARYNDEGQIECLGRMDGQVKLRGYRIEMGEIETLAEKFDTVGMAAAAVRTVGSVPHLVLYYTAKNDTVDEEALRSYIEKSSLADYMYPDIYMFLDEMPRLPNGKVNRRGLPEPSISADTEYAAPENDKEEKLISAMKKVLGLDENIGALDSFFKWGGDSIKAIRMVSLLRQEGLTVSVAQIMSAKTVRKIAEVCRENNDTDMDIRPVSGDVGMSPVYEHFFESRYAVPAHFNQAVLYRFNSRADKTAVQKALDKLVEHHDMLRAVYNDNKVVIHNTDFKIKLEKAEAATSEDITAICESIQENIDMDKALLRACFIVSEKTDYLFLCAHHLIIDGVSWRILGEDFANAYSQALSGKEIVLSRRTHPYTAYVQAMENYRDSYALKQEVGYWKSVEAKVRKYPNRNLHEGTGKYNHLTITLDEEQTRRILSANMGVLNLEVNDIWLTAAAMSYKSISGENALSVQMEGHGREEIGAELMTDRTVGWFTSMYPTVFENISGDISADLLVVKETLRKIPNHGVGYPLLRTPLNGESAVTPWLVFNYLGEMDAEEHSDDIIVTENDIPTGAIWNEQNYQGSALMLNTFVRGGKITLMLDYDKDIYTAEEAESFIRGVTDSLSEISEYLETVSPKLTPSDLGELEWSMEEFEAVRAGFAADNVAIQRILPLSGMQEAMLLKHMAEPDSFAYRLVFIYKCGWLPTQEQLNKALERILSHHEILRSSIVYEGVHIYRQVITDRIPKVEMYDFSRYEHSDEMVMNLRYELLKNSFDLQHKPLFRLVFVKVSDKSGYLITVSHHIIQDGWSMQLYMEDLWDSLAASKEGRILPETDNINGVYEQAVRELSHKDRDKALNYWSALLSDYETRGEIPSFGEVPPAERTDDEDTTLLSAKETEEFSKLCMQSGATLSNGIELAWGMVLQTYSRSRDVIFGKVVSGRDNTSADVNNVVGLFINSVPVRLHINEKTTARGALHILQTQAIESNPYDFCSIGEIMSAAGIENDLLKTVLAFENYSGGKEKKTEFAGLPVSIFCMKEEIFDAVNPVAMLDEKGRLCLHIGFDNSKFRLKEIKRIGTLFRHFINVMTQFPDMPLRMLPRANEAALREIAEISCGEQLEYNNRETFVQMFVNMAKQYPDNDAVADMEGKLSYKELDRLSDRLAKYLIDRGVKPNNFVAVKMPRVKEFLASVIGIMKAGAAYIPVDPDYPAERISYMLNDSEAIMTVTEDTFTQLDENAEQVDLSTPDGRAYMIYTSGSTGKPKGVVQPHSSLRAYLAWRKELLDINENSRHAQHSSFSFDASLDDLLCPVAFGGSVHILGDEIRKDMTEMVRYFSDNDITGLTMPTQMGMAMLDQFPEMKVKFLMMGGEKMLPFKRTPIRVINGYGPTEFTVCSSYHIVSQDKDKDIPIGRAVPNTFSLILDEAGKLLPKGLVGELCLVGPQMAECYWKHEDLTNEKFVNLPEVAQITHGDTRVYRTGDLARYNENGELEYLGRIDDQVKLRGFRIELGEIESAAARFEGIAHAVAKVCKSGSMQVLCLYYTSAEKIDENALKRSLSEELAEYMVPNVLMRLDTMPLTPNGKVNRKALPAPVMTSSAEYVAPESEAEKAVAETIKSILSLEQPVGALDNFFELGGDSIKAIRMVSLLRACNAELSVSDIMKYKTVRSIAKVCRTKSEKRAVHEAFTGRLERSPIMHFFDDLHLPKPEYFYQSQLLRCSERLDKLCLHKAVNSLLKQHDLLRAVYEYPYVNVPEWSESIYNRVLVNETYLSSDKNINRNIREICIGIKSNPDENNSMFRIAVIHGNDEDYIFMCAHHLIIDGVSWRILLSDMEDAYRQAEKGNDIVLPQKTDNYADFVKTLQSCRNSYAFEREIPYWQQVEAKMLSMPTSNGKDYTRSFDTLEFSVNKDRTRSILQARLANFGAERNDYLLTALAMTCHKQLGLEHMSLQLEGHGRENISDELVTDRTIGWFTSVYPVVFEDINTDIDKCFTSVKETLHRIPNKGVGYNILRYIQGIPDVSFERDRWAEFGFNYLGETHSGNSTESLFRAADDMDSGSDIAEENFFGPDLMINCLVENGIFRIYLQYNKAVYSNEQIKDFAEVYVNELERIAVYLSNMDEVRLTATDLGETEWSDKEFTRVLKSFAERGEHLERIYPLTSMQEGILLKYLADRDDPAYKLVTIFTLDALPSREQLIKATDRLLRKYEVLRSAIIYDGVREYRQAITDRTATVHMADISNESDKAEAVLRIREKILAGDYDLQNKPMFQITCAKTSDNSCYLIAATHHIIVDGWCIPLYFRDFEKFIDDEINGRSYGEDVTVANGAYEAAVREIREKDLRDAVAYWRGVLDGYDTAAGIPQWGENENADNENDTVESFIDKDTVERLSELCRQEQVTFGTAVELAWGLTIGTASGSEDVVYSKVVSGRDNTKTNVENIVGLFINSIPVRLKIDKDTTVMQALHALQEQAAASNKWDWCPLSAIIELTPLGNKLFQSVFAFENYDSGSQETEKTTDINMKVFYAKEENIDCMTPSASLTEDGSLRFRIVYDKTAWSCAEMQRVAKLYALLLSEIASSPDSRISELDRVDDDDRRDIIELAHGIELEYDTTKTWVDLFEEHLAEDGSRLAVNDTNGSYTYDELNIMSGKIAAYLRENGVDKNDFVAVRLPRSKEIIAAILGIHRLGAAYVPIDLEYPESRVNYMLTDCGAKAVIDTGFFEKLTDDTYFGRPSPDNLAYMIYTSGSTGKPKGVMLHHRGLMNFTVATALQNELTPDDRVANHRSFSFDAHIEDVFPVLSSGAGIYIMLEDIRKDFDRIYAFLTDNKITGCGFTTSIGKTLLTEYNLPVRYITVGGEALTGVLSGKVQVINEYGPTECTNDTCVYKLEKGRNYTSVPIGRPMPNSWCFVTDSNGKLLPKGFMGELCYAGPQVGCGYNNMPEKTAEVFGDCPFVEGMRMYKTGDLARYNEEGLIEALGRKDGQVKLRGYRIETGEVEEAALSCDMVQYVAASVREISGSNHLVLYYTQKEGQVLTEQELQKIVRRSELPDYMQPEIYVKLSEMPRLPNGKIDRRSLPLPEINMNVDNVAPDTAMEAHFLKAAREILPNIEFGMTDDLFALGLTSLTAMKLITRFNAMEYHQTYRVTDLMRFKNIRDMIDGNRRIYWQYGEANPDKPWLIFLYGIAPVAKTLAMLDKWTKDYNIFVIEAIDAHYDILFDDSSTFEDVVDNYALMMEQNLPDDARIAGMMGFSWGGALAYWLCAYWAEHHGARPFAMCGDTYFINETDEFRQPLVSSKDFPENLFDLTAGVITQKEVIRKTNISITIDNTVKEIPAYDGQVIMLNAMAECSLAMKKRNIEIIRSHAPNVEVIDFPNHSHNDLFFDETQVPIYLDIMKKHTP